MTPLTAQNLYQMRSGDLVFFRGSGPLAWLVRKWTRSPWAHVGMAVWINRDLMLLEADAMNGVQLVPMEAWKGCAWCPMGLDWNDAMTAQAITYEGEPYGWLDDLRVAFGLRPKFKGMQCAELVGKMLDAAGKPAPWAPTPAALARMYGGAEC